MCIRQCLFNNTPRCILLRRIWIKNKKYVLDGILVDFLAKNFKKTCFSTFTLWCSIATWTEMIFFVIYVKRRIFWHIAWKNWSIFNFSSLWTKRRPLSTRARYGNLLTPPMRVSTYIGSMVGVWFPTFFSRIVLLLAFYRQCLLKVPNQEKLTLWFLMFFWKSVLNLVGVTSSILPEVNLWADTVAQSYNGGLRFRVTTSAAF